MNMNMNQTKMHPLMVVALSAVILTCLIVAAVMTGIIPGPNSRDRADFEARIELPEGEKPGPLTLNNDVPLNDTRSSFSDTRAGRRVEPVERVERAEPRQPVRTERAERVERVERVERERPRIAVGSTGNNVSERSVAGSAPARVAAVCNNCGSVTSVRAVSRQGDAGIIGPLAGGALGGLVGSQIGGGSGKAIATVVGAAGGAAVGTEVERRQKSTTSYVVDVRLNDGSTQSFTYASAPGYEPGDRIRVVDGRLLRGS